MHPAQTEIDPLLVILWEVISAKGWCNSTNADMHAIQNRLGDEKCVFRALLCLDRDEEPSLKLTGSFRSLLRQLTQSGLSLQLAWPRGQAPAVDEWLGRRFYFSASTNLSANERYVSLVSSQLGRHGSKVPSWPTLVDAALQNARRDRERPLILPGTSLSEATQQYSSRANLNSLQIQLDDRPTIESWLKDLLSELESASPGWPMDEIVLQSLTELRISPPLQSDAPELASLPLQDRVAIALADRVMAIHIRRNGTIAKLTQRRLADNRFPTGSVYIASTLGQPSGHPPELNDWLERGAVGWLLLEPTRQLDQLLSNCRKKCLLPFVQSLCAPMPAHWKAAQGNSESYVQNEWPYLAHCTRGNSGPLPNESLEQFRDRAWIAGVIPDSHPLVTLQQILIEKLIKGNSWLTRSQYPCISFSEVPLAELLSRRQFRSHLGRWDWEPYGILVRREALKGLGARSVIYGDEADYKQLADHDKPYFQPRGTKTARNHQDWSSEREWRLLGDLNLSKIDRDAIVVFVATRSEAQQIARRFGLPVLWKDK